MDCHYARIYKLFQRLSSLFFSLLYHKWPGHKLHFGFMDARSTDGFCNDRNLCSFSLLFPGKKINLILVCHNIKNREALTGVRHAIVRLDFLVRSTLFMHEREREREDIWHKKNFFWYSKALSELAPLSHIFK